MFWRRGYTLRGEVGGDWALDFPSFLGPVKWHRADRRVPFGAWKCLETQRRTVGGGGGRKPPMRGLAVLPGGIRQRQHRCLAGGGGMSQLSVHLCYIYGKIASQGNKEPAILGIKVGLLSLTTWTPCLHVYMYSIVCRRWTRKTNVCTLIFHGTVYCTRLDVQFFKTERFTEKYRLRRLCTMYISFWGVACLWRDTVRLWLVMYRVQWIPSVTHQQIQCQPPHTLLSFQRPSAGYSQPHSDNFCNFLRRL